MTNGGELTVVEGQAADYVPSFAIRLDESARRLADFQAFIEGQMVKDEDYGVIPGTEKPTLLKPGAEKLCNIFGFAPHFNEVRVTEDWDNGFFYYAYDCQLFNKRTGQIEANCTASCNSLEDKYRWRQGQRKCPKCGAEAIIKGKQEFGGGWICWVKREGCGAKFADGDESIEGQKVGRIPNPDPYTLVNTIQKMAQKRALIGATLIATRASGIFTQDIEDLDLEPQAEPKATQPKVKTKAKKGNGGKVSLDATSQYWAYVRENNIDQAYADDTVRTAGGDFTAALALLQEEVRERVGADAD